MSALFEKIDLPADRLPGDALVVPLFEDQRPLAGPAAVVDWRFDGAVTQMIMAASLSGKSGECLGMQANAKFAATWVLLVGAGRWRSLDCERYQHLLGRLLKTAEKAGLLEVALCLPPCAEVPASELEAMVRQSLSGMRKMTRCRLSLVSGLH